MLLPTYRHFMSVLPEQASSIIAQFDQQLAIRYPQLQQQEETRVFVWR
uniref:Uncharacterized protein n=1 Tax=Erwinia amylovora ATCC BAA-2158 TaxID=889211 RepID=E5B311_ERWAM|nr:hypothetical protein predicted by Glimmer/Critica [Erwinia amylovora ATCC BAA-2158]